jgi:hypothetical protein|tara:strand:+ start:814 stop:1263 length:450 start_codon:yes stop_codon:yes gene_type:complete
MSDNELTVISPEGLVIAEAYLKNGSDSEKTATDLGLPLEEVIKYMGKREVKAYVDQLYFEGGFRNRERFAGVMDEIIAFKLEEMEDTGMGSNKDILEIMKEMHSMKMKEMDMQIKLLAAEKSGGPAIQVNQQTNNNYNSLLEKILEEGK